MLLGWQPRPVFELYSPGGHSGASIITPDSCLSPIGLGSQGAWDMPLQGGLYGQAHSPPRPLLLGRVLTAPCISAVKDLRSHSVSRSSWRPLEAALEPTPSHMGSPNPDP